MGGSLYCTPYRSASPLYILIESEGLPAVSVEGLPAVPQAGHGTLQKAASSGSKSFGPMLRPESWSAGQRANAILYLPFRQAAARAARNLGVDAA
jgi:hypothetical protein